MDAPPPSAVMRSPHVATADLYCAGGARLELETDWHRGLGWWRVDGDGRTRLSVADAFVQVPRSLEHEVLLEAEHLVDAVLREDLGEDGTDIGRRLGAEALRDEIRDAKKSLRELPSMRSFGHDLADHLVD